MSLLSICTCNIHHFRKLVKRNFQEERDLGIIRLEQIEISTDSMNNAMDQDSLFLKN